MLTTKLSFIIYFMITLLLILNVCQAKNACDMLFVGSSDTVREATSLYKFLAPSRIGSKAIPIVVAKSLETMVPTTNVTTSSGATDSMIQASTTTKAPIVETDGISVSQTNTTVTTTNISFKLKSMHCLYKFVANQNERVSLSFTRFKLRGDEPECSREYIDVYSRFSSGVDIERAIESTTPNGRFCTSVVPRKSISLHNMIVLSIYTELPPMPRDNGPLFEGTYEFIKQNSYEQIGLPEDNTLCTHTIYSSTRREGEFQSVTYPGVYLKDLLCVYKFIGEPGQRIRLEFLDFDLYSGAPHCPFDYVKVFDGRDESAPLINTFCGSHRSLIVYSTGENLLVTFTTLKREADIQNRGFSAYFEFSDKFLDLSFIKGPNAKHIRGSECDQRIVSSNLTRGIIEAPDTSRQSNAVCRYIFEGLQNSFHYERVKLQFSHFDLKTPRPSASILAQQTPSVSQQLSGDQAASSLTGTNTSSEICPDNYVRIYASEQKPDQKQDPNDYDHMFCGNELPPSIESDRASMLLEYSSVAVGYFRAEFEFIMDFRVQGIQESSGCEYSYRSDYSKTGSFNSPRHPSWYINDMNCSYTFHTKPDEALVVQFTSFNMSNPFNGTIAGYNKTCLEQDRVEIFELPRDTLSNSDPQSIAKFIAEMHEIGTYCGVSAPGPILTFRPLKVYFRTNKDGTCYGFNAIYGFYQMSELKSNEFVTNCGGQINANLKNRSGSISNPATYRPETYEKRHHICSWNITARPGHRIALEFVTFTLDGVPMARGCATASVRIMTNPSSVPTELCGKKTNAFFVSEYEWLGVTFMSTNKASGEAGFTANWTEIKRVN